VPSTAVHQGRGPVEQDRASQLEKSVDGGTVKRLPGKVRQGGPTPSAQRIGEQVRSSHELARRESDAPAICEVAGYRNVQFSGSHDEAVSVSLAHQPLRLVRACPLTQHATPKRHVGVYKPDRSARRPIAPDAVDETLDRNQPAGLEQEDG
jgi:hypothetical protein